MEYISARGDTSVGGDTPAGGDTSPGGYLPANEDTHVEVDVHTVAADVSVRGTKGSIYIVHDNYEHIPDILERLAIGKADGILLDLGVSSFQLDTPERGFSYRDDAPLDMRMDRTGAQTAADLVNTLPESALYRIIRDYGEEKFAKNIAKHIAAAREEGPIATTGQLTEIVKRAIPMRVRAVGGHPAKQTFQAIRIAVNRELDVLESSLDGLVDCLKPAGRLCVITFHSLEDRIVKNKFREWENPCTCPKDFPVCVCGRKSKGFAVTKKPIAAGGVETAANPRAKSAKLRVFERIAGPAGL
ncbi:MAG: 16S rRNA (cytosine(1402)-N(4))-methyltransferase RsmH [Lachnospiraceae bacterium]|jgi:16S rRNA (cytosine1402-N4)-methyltransferase|nr:16S rRNA (cytosine(1402)-N(4))-methyltransferase RsmH [Lachnospiraceae bacterium]